MSFCLYDNWNFMKNILIKERVIVSIQIIILINNGCDLVCKALFYEMNVKNNYWT